MIYKFAGAARNI